MRNFILAYCFCAVMNFYLMCNYVGLEDKRTNEPVSNKKVRLGLFLCYSIWWIVFLPLMVIDSRRQRKNGEK